MVMQFDTRTISGYANRFALAGKGDLTVVNRLDYQEGYSWEAVDRRVSGRKNILANGLDLTYTVIPPESKMCLVHQVGNHPYRVEWDGMVHHETETIYKLWRSGVFTEQETKLLQAVDAFARHVHDLATEMINDDKTDKAINRMIVKNIVRARKSPDIDPVT